MKRIASNRNLEEEAQARTTKSSHDVRYNLKKKVEETT